MRAGGTAARRATVVMLSLVVAAAVVGCTPDDEPGSPIAATSVQPPSPSVSPTVFHTARPDAPDVSAAPTVESAVATARHFLALYGYMYATGDVAPWDALRADTCEQCLRTRDEAVRLTNERAVSTGSTYDVESEHGVEVLPGVGFTVTAVVRQSPWTTWDSTGAVLSDDPGGRYGILVALEWQDGWKVRAIDTQELAPDGMETSEDLRWD